MIKKLIWTHASSLSCMHGRRAAGMCLIPLLCTCLTLLRCDINGKRQPHRIGRMKRATRRREKKRKDSWIVSGVHYEMRKRRGGRERKTKREQNTMISFDLITWQSAIQKKTFSSLHLHKLSPTHKKKHNLTPSEVGWYGSYRCYCRLWEPRAATWTVLTALRGTLDKSVHHR